MADAPLNESPDLPPPLPPSPVPRPRRERLPGTYAGNYLDVDPSPTMGGVVTAGLFALVFVLETVHLLAAVLGGFDEFVDLFSLIRVGLFSLALIALWVGAAPARWALSAGAFLFGSGVLTSTLAAGSAALLQSAMNLARLPLGFTYLAIFVYLGFSSNVVAFAKEQRTPGKAFSVLRIVLLCAAALGSLVAVRPAALVWYKLEQARARVYAEESLRAISAHWDPKEFDARADAGYVAEWPVEAKKSVMKSMSRYGAVRAFGQTYSRVYSFFNVDEGFHWRGSYRSTDDFEHGRATMSLEMDRTLFTPWRITAWTLAPERVEPPPSTAPAPAATEVPVP